MHVRNNKGPDTRSKFDELNKKSFKLSHGASPSSRRTNFDVCKLTVAKLNYYYPIH